MAFVNLTPHRITLLGRNGPVVLDPCDTPARVEHNEMVHKVHQGVPVKVYCGPLHITGLPDRREDTLYVVSRMVKDMVTDRDDCVVPAELLRDDKGHIVGAKAVAL